MDLKFRTLRADEIDCRVNTVSEKGCSLLLYKDARCDMNILDEMVGATGWMRSHSRDNANCTVSIWDEDKKQWISKEDTGTESHTEKEKGLASDSFKRACFNWGIGRELYSAPSIWIRANDVAVKENGTVNGKKKYTTYDRFYVSDIGVDKGVITSLTIKKKNSNKVVYTYDSTEQEAEEERTDPQEEEYTLDEDILRSIYDLANVYSQMLTNVSVEKILNMLQSKYRYTDVKILRKENALTVIECLEKWIEKQQEKNESEQ